MQGEKSVISNFRADQCSCKNSGYYLTFQCLAYIDWTQVWRNLSFNRKIIQTSTMWTVWTSYWYQIYNEWQMTISYGSKLYTYIFVLNIWLLLLSSEIQYFQTKYGLIPMTLWIKVRLMIQRSVLLRYLQIRKKHNSAY